MQTDRPKSYYVREALENYLKGLGYLYRRQNRKLLRERLSVSDNPKSLGKQLSGSISQFWRFRVGDYRIICDIQDDELVIIALRIAHRKEVY